jgi:hypothetical protein
MLYKTRIITLNSITPQTGSVFLLEYSSDCTNYYTTSVSNITGSGDIYIPITYTSSLNWDAYLNTITLASVGATASVLIPDTATCLRLTNLVGECSGSQYVEVIGSAPTGSTTTTTTTTTAAPTTTTTTTLAPTTTTTTTLAPTTTTTTTSGPTYNYYDVTRFTCPSCTSPTGGIVARNNTTYGTLTTSNYYNNGDGYVYRIDGYNAGPSYTIDLDLAASAGTNCSLTCAI